LLNGNFRNCQVHAGVEERQTYIQMAPALKNIAV